MSNKTGVLREDEMHQPPLASFTVFLLLALSYNFPGFENFQGTPRENSALIFSPWWAVPVLAVITAIFWCYREPPKSVPPKYEIPGTAKKCTGNRRKSTAILKYRRKSTTILQYRQKSTAILEYRQKSTTILQYRHNCCTAKKALPYCSTTKKNPLFPFLFFLFFSFFLFLYSEKKSLGDRRHLPTHTCCCPECVVQQNHERCRWESQCY